MPPSEAKGVSDSGTYGCYSETLSFFQTEIDDGGVEATIQNLVFRDNEAATDMLERLYTGKSSHLYDNFIPHKPRSSCHSPGLWDRICTTRHSGGRTSDGCGIKKPFGSIFSDAEKVANAQQEVSRQKIAMLNDELRQDRDIIAAKDGCGPDESDYLHKGPLTKCPENVIRYMSQWRVEETPDSVKEKLAELINCSGMFSIINFLGADFNPGPELIQAFSSYCSRSSRPPPESHKI